MVALDCVSAEAVGLAETLKLESVRYMAAFVTAYEQLLEEKPVTCFATKTEFPAVSPPKMVVLDVRVISLLTL